MIVIKVGGASGVDLMTICTDVVTLVQSGKQVVLVHGGSHATNQLGEQLGHMPKFLTSVTGVRSRYTDPVALDIFTMAIAGKVKPLLVAQLQKLGAKAIGLTGIDGALIQARRKSAIKVKVGDRIQIVRDDLTGRITGINTSLLSVLLSVGYVPVVSPPALDPSVGPLNVDADRVAAAIATAMHAEELVILSNVPGVLRDLNDPASLVKKVSVDQWESCLALTQGRMRIKMIAAGEALQGGVKRVIFGDGRLPSPVFQALNGRGTMLQAEDVIEEVHG